jgi:hypothetical protein
MNLAFVKIRLYNKTGGVKGLTNLTADNPKTQFISLIGGEHV